MKYLLTFTCLISLNMCLRAQDSLEVVEGPKPVEVLSDAKAEEAPLYVVEQMPEFPGGEASMMRFIAKNVKYPKEARDRGIQGMVIVRFVVLQDGSLSDIKVIKDIGYGCGEEAVRVVKKMPKWKPGLQRGKPVKVILNLPINFKLM